MKNDNAYEELDNFKKEGDYYISQGQKCEEEGDDKSATVMLIMAELYYENMLRVLRGKTTAMMKKTV